MDDASSPASEISPDSLIVWKGITVGALREAVPDMWYLDGRFEPTSTPQAALFCSRAGALDGRKVFADLTQGLLVELTSVDGVPECAAVVLSLTDGRLWMRRVFEQTVVERLRKECPGPDVSMNDRYPVMESRAILNRARRRYWLGRMFGRHPSRFGAAWHGYQRERCLKDAEVAEFERQWKVSLPEEYRIHLQAVGNGGAGPFYGLSRLSEWCQPDEPDEVSPEILQMAFQPTGARLGPAPGCLRICNAGCEHYYVLVLTGPHRGEVWHDAQVDNRGLVPVTSPGGSHQRFREWYESWLHDWTTGTDGVVGDAFWSTAEFPGHALAQVLEEEESGGTCAVDQLPCPACVRVVRRLGARVIVPTTGSPLENPKVVARRAAKSGIRIRPRTVNL
jgi:hypothetical protein